MLKHTKEMPEEGQFVAIYIYNNLLWSDTLRWYAGKLQEYREKEDDWKTLDSLVNSFYSERNKSFITLTDKQEQMT